MLFTLLRVFPCFSIFQLCFFCTRLLFSYMCFHNFDCDGDLPDPGVVAVSISLRQSHGGDGVRLEMTVRQGVWISIDSDVTFLDLGSFVQIFRIMDAALDKAIKEIIGPVIQRSVTIATRTTKELILKDLAMESDDSVVSRDAHLMVGMLARSLAHVTAKMAEQHIIHTQ
ncbi:hypothetical protein ACQJBY_000999 [Aegilops geniculata]